MKQALNDLLDGDLWKKLFYFHIFSLFSNFSMVVGHLAMNAYEYT